MPGHQTLFNRESQARLKSEVRWTVTRSNLKSLQLSPRADDFESAKPEPVRIRCFEVIPLIVRFAYPPFNETESGAKSSVAK